MTDVLTFLELQNAVTANPDTEFSCRSNLNLYDSRKLERLATQAVAGRQLRIIDFPSHPSSTAIHVKLCEDDYSGWIAAEDIDVLNISETAYRPIVINEADVLNRLPRVIQYTYVAMHQANHYLWGGTVGPNYDCSGLMQAAFLSVGIWIPRDAYQQHAFTQPVSIDNARPGDLVFFGTDQRITHVGLFLGDRRYIHSSGKEIGRNGIGIDELSDQSGTVSQAYFKQFNCIGRVMQSYLGEAH